MTRPIPLHEYTYREYLAYEESSNVKHEFLDGEIYAMAGGSPGMPPLPSPSPPR